MREPREMGLCHMSEGNQVNQDTDCGGYIPPYVAVFMCTYGAVVVYEFDSCYILNLLAYTTLFL